MARTKDCWGIEVGADAIKAIRLLRDGNDVTVAAYDVLPFKKVLTTPDLNVDEQLQLGLDQFASRHDLRRSTVMVSVPGHMAFARFAKLPPVDPKKIPDIVKFEAVQQIPFPMDQVEWDYQVFQQPDSPDVEVGIFAITKERVAQFLSNYRAVNLLPDGLTLSPLAVYNAFAYDLNLTPESDGMIFMDIGTTATDLIIVEAGAIWLRTLPIGGNNFTDALVRAFKLSFPKAEKLKREAGTSKYARQIFQAMRPVFADLVQEMQRSLGYYQSLNRDAKLTKLVGVGSTFRLPGLQKFLKQQLQMEVTRPSRPSGEPGFNRIGVEGKQAADFADHALNMATAYGLALQGLGLESVGANILPSHILKQRLWKGKQPWIAAAACLMLAASGGAWLRQSWDRSAFDSAMAQNQSHIDSVLNKANGYVNDWRRIEGGSDPRQKIDNLQRILDYRDVWPKLLQDVDEALRALGPEPVLLGPDYNAIAQIPRDNRRVMHIESATVEYQFELEQAAEASPSAAALSFADIWGDRRAPSPGGGPPGMPPQTGPMPTGPGAWGTPPRNFSPGAPSATPTVQTQVGSLARKPPSFVITLRGVTPYREASKMISHYFIKWLQDNAERGNRPYKIIATPQSLVSLEELPWVPPDDQNSEAPGRGGVPVFTPGGRPGVPGFEAPAPTSFGRPTIPGADPGFARAAAGTPGQTVETSALLPQRPLTQEPRNRDWRFTVSWTVQLIRPDDARLAEDVSTPAPGSAPRSVPRVPGTPENAPAAPGGVPVPATPAPPAAVPTPQASAHATEDRS